MVKVRALIIGLVTLGVLGASTSACSSEPWDGKVYHAGRATFRHGPVPNHWQRMDVAGAMLAFQDRNSSGSVNSCRPPMMLTTVTKRNVGRSIGKVIDQNCRHRDAPSMAADS